MFNGQIKKKDANLFLPAVTHDLRTERVCNMLFVKTKLGI